MPDILTLLSMFEKEINRVDLRPMAQIITAMLIIPGRVTMEGLSRWTGPSGSCRQIKRWMQKTWPWANIVWLFFSQRLWHPSDTYLLAGDEVVVTKSGRKTYGLGRFYASLLGKSVPGLSFFALSVINVRERRSYPLLVEQNLKTAKAPEKTAHTPVTQAKAKGPLGENQTTSQKSQSGNKSKEVPEPQTPKNQGGRPKGSRTKDKREVELTPELQKVKSMVSQLLQQVKGVLPLTYLLLDGHFGNHNAFEMTQQLGLHLISRFRQDIALYFPYQKTDPASRSRRKYGDQLRVGQIPKEYLRETETKDDEETQIYQAQLWHRTFSAQLNVVIIVKTNTKTKEQKHSILFSSDLELSYEKIIDYYSLRFQIEFNFRDAKQFWGLEDFMNTTQSAVTNAVNLAFFMVNFSHYLLHLMNQNHPGSSINDLKAYYRGRKYVEETLKLLPDKPAPSLLAMIWHNISNLGRIHPVRLDSHFF